MNFSTYLNQLKNCYPLRKIQPLQLFFKKHPHALGPVLALLWGASVLVFLNIQTESQNQARLLGTLALLMPATLAIVSAGFIWHLAGRFFSLIYSLLVSASITFLLAYFLFMGNIPGLPEYSTIWQSNAGEGFSCLGNILWGINSLASYIILGASFLFILFLLINGLKQLFKKRMPKAEHNYLTAGLLLALSLFSFATLLLSPSLVQDIWASREFYKNNLDKFRLQELSADLLNLAQSTKVDGQVHLVIIGESLSKRHMSVYGYERPTTPKLADYDADELIWYQDAIPTYTHTMPSLSTILYDYKMPGDNPHPLALISLLKAAGFECIWLSAQHPGGVEDTVLSLQSRLADSAIFLFKEKRLNLEDHYDLNLLPKLETILMNKKPSKGQVIFVHTMGSHWLYEDRYPQEFDIFNEKLAKKNKISTLDKKNILRLDNYDNTVAYTDNFLHKILNLAKKNPNVASVTFFSDHGEDVYSGFAHEGGRSRAMFEVPLFFWFSPAYKNARPELWQNLKKHANLKISLEDLFDTIAQVAGLPVGLYDSQRSLASAEFQEKIRYVACLLPGFKDWQTINYDLDYPKEDTPLAHK